MKPLIHFKCTNEQCTAFDVAVPLPDRSFFETIKLEMGDEQMMRYQYCPACHQSGGQLSIQHGAHTFASFEAYKQHISKLIEVTQLLARLEVAGAASDVDAERLRDNKALLAGAKCPCCGGSALDAINHA